jgi:thiamine pyrophosphokinase
MDGCALVLAGGDPVDPRLLGRLPPTGLVIAADSGLHLAEPLGLRVDRVVGDLDSADPARVDAVEAAGAVIERHPVAKDATDLELAMEAAVRAGATCIVVVGGSGGRADHLFANVLLLAHRQWAGTCVEAWIGDAHMLVVHGGHAPRGIAGEPGSLVTLLPVGGPAHGVVTVGLEYSLARETLEAGTSRGVSNVMAGTTASVALESGTLLVVQPLSGSAS